MKKPKTGLAGTGTASPEALRDADFAITREFIRAGRSPGGGLTRRQLAILGLQMPAHPRSFRKLIYRRIPWQHALEFVSANMVGPPAPKPANQTEILTLLELKKRARDERKGLVMDNPPTAEQVKQGRRNAKKKLPVLKEAFLLSVEWWEARTETIARYGARCMRCSATPEDGVPINVDHIKPRRIFPELALDRDNLQVLCGPCNKRKGNVDMTDYRPPT